MVEILILEKVSFNSDNALHYLLSWSKLFLHVDPLIPEWAAHLSSSCMSNVSGRVTQCHFVLVGVLWKASCRLGTEIVYQLLGWCRKCDSKCDSQTYTCSLGCVTLHCHCLGKAMTNHSWVGLQDTKRRKPQSWRINLAVITQGFSTCDKGCHSYRKFRFCSQRWPTFIFYNSQCYFKRQSVFSIPISKMNLC